MSDVQITVELVHVLCQGIRLSNGTILVADLTEPQPRWAVVGNDKRGPEIISTHEDEDSARAAAFDVVVVLKGASGSRALQ